DDVHFLQAVANLLAAAFQRWRGEQELARVKDELALQLADMTHLHRLSARLSATLDLPAVLQEVLAAVTRLQRTEQGLLLLYDRDRGDLTPGLAVGLSDDYLRELGRVGPGAGVYGSVLARRQGVVVEDIEADEAFAGERPAARRAGFRAVCATPLLTRGG